MEKITNIKYIPTEVRIEGDEIFFEDMWQGRIECETCGFLHGSINWINPEYPILHCPGCGNFINKIIYEY